MSAGRLSPEVAFTECAKPVRYVFCLGVPRALAADYLRIAGALMRLFKDADTEGALRVARTREEFVHVLSRLETRL
jgi:PTS system nitrogen regulatory IIA component